MIPGQDHQKILQLSDSDLNGNKPSIFWEEMMELTACSSHRVSSQENACEEASSSSRTSVKQHVRICHLSFLKKYLKIVIYSGQFDQ